MKPKIAGIGKMWVSGISANDVTPTLIVLDDKRNASMNLGIANMGQHTAVVWG